jgi:outer membrane lipoprotein-sorting protein
MKQSIKHDMRGVAHLLVVVGLVAVVAVVGFVGWRVMNKSGGNAVTNEISKKLAEANCEYDDKDLCKFFVSWKEHKQYRMTSSGGGETDTMVYETDGDKNHMAMFGSMQYEVITQGRTTYTKDFTDNKWWKQTLPEDKSTPTDDVDVDFDEPSKEEEKDKTQYKKLGTDACGSLTCFKYQVIETDRPDDKEFIWFDSKDYQLRKTRSESKDGVNEATFEYTNVKVSIPADVKELGPNQYIVPGSSEPMTAPSDAEIQAQMDALQAQYGDFGSEE